GSIKREWLASDVHREIYDYAMKVPKGSFNVGQMFSYITDDEVNNILNINMKFATDASEESYYNDCLIALADECLKAQLEEVKKKYNSLSDPNEKRAAVGEIAVLQKKIKSKSVQEKL
ncbi:MAG: hypothetical protein HDT36_01200, partial [Clostridiales bacterium]|nr:hypothetical protein [Clostridiales bacterium]